MNKLDNTLSWDKLEERLDYNPETGDFSWKVDCRPRIKSGDKAGYSKKTGRTSYLIIGLFGKKYLAHRLAWLYMEGCFPNQIDHIDHNGLNNKWSNLRNVSSTENSRNQRLSIKNTSGHTGVSWDKTAKKWHASIMVHGKTRNLGIYSNKEHAIFVRKQAEQYYFFHENHGRLD